MSTLFKERSSLWVSPSLHCVSQEQKTVGSYERDTTVTRHASRLRGKRENVRKTARSSFPAIKNKKLDLPRLREISVDVTSHTPQTRGRATLIPARVRLRLHQPASQCEHRRVREDHSYLRLTPT